MRLTVDDARLYSVSVEGLFKKFGGRLIVFRPEFDAPKLIEQHKRLLDILRSLEYDCTEKVRYTGCDVRLCNLRCR